MADGTKIEWTDATWNPVTGCSVVSPGCTNCYAMRLAGTRMRHHPSRHGLTVPSKAGPVWNGTVRFNSDWLLQPLQWKRPRRIFVCAHGDLFHEAVPDAVIDQVFAVMALCPQHQFQVLTKRPQRMRDYLADHDVRAGWVLPACKAVPNYIDSELCVTRPGLPLPNVWLGVSVEDQARADERVPVLLETPAAVRWLSCEPLLGPVDLTSLALSTYVSADALTGVEFDELGPRGRNLAKIDWVVAGGESGPGARPMHPDWARSLRDQCADASVPFLFKQWGEWRTLYDRDREDPDWRRADGFVIRYPRGRWLNVAGGHGFHGERVVYVDRGAKKIAGRLLDGVAHDGFPA